MAPLVVACGLLTIAAGTAARAGRKRRKTRRDLEHANNSERLLRSCDKELSDTIGVHGGRYLTEASGGTAPALQTGGKGVWSHTTDSTYAFRFKDFTFNAQNVFTGWVIIYGGNNPGPDRKRKCRARNRPSLQSKRRLSCNSLC